MTAPVHKSRSVIVRDVAVDDRVLKMYLSNTRRSGGGAIESIKREGNDAIITFESIDSISKVLKRIHTLEGHTFRAECYYVCPIPPPSLPASYSHEQWIHIEDKDVLFFMSMQENIKKEFQDHISLFSLDQINKQVKISANSELALKQAVSDLMTLTRSIKVRKLEVSVEISALFKTDPVKDFILAALKNEDIQVVVCFEKDPPCFVYKDPTDGDDVAKIITQQVVEKVKPIHDNSACRLLSSHKGQEFLIGLNKYVDWTVKFDPLKNSATLVALHSKMNSLEEYIDKFLRENVLKKRKVSFDPGRLKFIKLYKKNMIDSMSTWHGIEVKAAPDGFILSGRKDMLKSKLIGMRQAVHTDNVLVQYFGVQEFVKSKEGSDKFKEIEALHQCCLEPHFSPVSASSTSQRDALTLTLGDITTINCEAIACTVKDTLDLATSATVSKILLKKSGSGLQTELSSKDISQTGIVHTSAPSLPCRNIYFISLDKFDKRWDKGSERLLKQAEADGIQSIALPLFGAGNKNLEQLKAIKEKIEQGVKAFYSSQTNHLKDIKLVIYYQETYNFIQRGFHHTEQKSINHKLAAPIPGSPIKIDMPKVSKDMRVTIHGNNAEHTQTVGAKVTETLRNCFQEVTVDLDKQLSPRQIRKLDQVAHRECVQLQYETKAVRLGSFFLKALPEITKQIYETLRQTEKQELISEAVSAGSWQYKDSSSTWRDFDKNLCGKLEVGLKSKQSGCTLIDTRGRKKKIDFTSKPMKETQLDVNGSAVATFEIRRVDDSDRPTFPKRWDSLHSADNLRLVDVITGSEEFADVKGAFRLGGVNSHIKSIQRVENKSLFLQFAAKMKEMEDRNGHGFQNELRLFHGTDADTMRKIISNGFSRNYSGRNATAFGEGVYFAVDSSYSKGYTSHDDNGDRFMVLTRVLVGRSTKSTRGMKALPDQPGTNPPVPYDSGTDDRKQMYIIFHDSQAYPEYVIKF